MLDELIREYITKDILLWVVALEHIRLIAYFFNKGWKRKRYSVSSDAQENDA